MTIDFSNTDGLVPAIVQDANTKRIDAGLYESEAVTKTFLAAPKTVFGKRRRVVMFYL